MSGLISKGFPGGSDGKASTCNAGNLGSMPGSGRSPGEGNVDLKDFLGGPVVKIPPFKYKGHGFNPWLGN